MSISLTKPTKSVLRLIVSINRFSTCNQLNFKVTLCGAGTSVGEPLALLLKQSSAVKELSLFDSTDTHGLAADLSHIETSTKVNSYYGPIGMERSLEKSNVVIIAYGESPGSKLLLNPEETFLKNATVVKDIASNIAKYCPKAMIGVMTNPVNSTVPICAEMMKQAGVFDPYRLFGISTLDACRANIFIAQLKGLNVWDVHCPIIGGNSGNTIVPVISQCTPKVRLRDEQLETLVKRIQEAEIEVVKAKRGGCAYFSTAYAGARFITNLLRALQGEPNIVECSYVQSNVTEARYFLTPIKLGKNGVETNLGIPKLSTYETHLMKTALPFIKKNIEEGELFANKFLH